MIDDIDAALTEARAQIAAATTTAELTAAQTGATGKRATLTTLKTRLGGIEDLDARKAAGRAINDAFAAIAAAVADRSATLAADEHAATEQAERLDLTELAGPPTRGHAHLVTQAWERLEDVFVGLGFRVAEGPEVETDWHNFEALNMPESHPARNEFDTLFVDHIGETDPDLDPEDAELVQRRIVLRTHTSPVQIRAMLEQEPPIYVVAPGRVFRRDTPDATHMPIFHQIEGLVVDRDISMADLAGTIEAFTKAFFGPGFSSRLRPSYFPFTEPSAEFDIRRPDGSWLELGGCGMVHPNVLRAGGIDPEVWSGFAFGFGIDRMSTARHEVTDLRDMFADDLRFVEQF